MAMLPEQDINGGEVRYWARVQTKVGYVYHTRTLRRHARVSPLWPTGGAHWEVTDPVYGEVASGVEETDEQAKSKAEEYLEGEEC